MRVDSARGRLGLFGLRDFRLVWLGETASNLGNGVTTVALPLIAVVTLHAGAFATGLLAAGSGCRGSSSGCRPERGSTGSRYGRS